MILKTLKALEEFIAAAMPGKTVLSAYAYPWNLDKDSGAGGEKIVAEVSPDIVGTSGIPGMQVTTARGVWTEFMSFLVTYQRPVNSQDANSIALAGVAAERIYPIFRKRALDGMDVKWVSTIRRPVLYRDWISGANLFRVPFIVTYRCDHMEKPR